MGLLQDVYEEYDRLRRGGAGGTFHAALLAANEARNRYSNVLPFDANRMRLQARSHAHLCALCEGHPACSSLPFHTPAASPCQAPHVQHSAES